MDRAEQRKQLLKQAVRLYNEGNPAEALPIYLKCLDLFGDEERSSLEFADFCRNYGSALAESGNQKLAEKMFTSALLIYGSQNQREDLAQTHFNLGNVYFYMNSRQPCHDHYMQALDGYRELGDSSGEGQCLLQLANFYAGMGVYDVVREWLAEIDGLDDSVKHDPTFRWSWLSQQAKAALHEGQPEYALKLLNEALDCARQTKIPPRQRNLWVINRSRSDGELRLRPGSRPDLTLGVTRQRGPRGRSFRLRFKLAARWSAGRPMLIFCLNLQPH